MNGDVVFDIPGDLSPDPCTCEAERPRTVTQHFHVAPVAGGGTAPGTEDEADCPSTWRRVEAVADPFELAHLVGTVLHEVMGLDVRAPITVEVFGAEWPCAACAWGAEPHAS